MAETEQPKKGSTSKFSDTLGKVDALIFNAMGVNVESLLDALGIPSLKDLFNIDWSKINWAKFLNILYALNPAQLKMLLSKFNLSNFNLGMLLSMFGISTPMIAMLEQIKTAFGQGGGIFTGGTSRLGIDGSFIPATGWLPGYDESDLDINNPPSTGLRVQTPDDPNDPKYIPPGSENLLNVLAGVNSPEAAIEALTPPGGNGNFYYEYMETPVRFDASKFVPWTDVGGFDYLRSYFCQQLGYVPSYSDFEITKEEGRVDLVANSMFEGVSNPTQYWWIVLMYNGIYDIEELKCNTKLKCPDLSALEDLYFRVKSIGENK